MGENFFKALVKDGRPLLSLTALCLIFSGLFACFLGVTGHYLPHDVAFLGMTPEKLCEVNECRIVHFMIHDRIAFGGALLAVGVLYLWLVEFPLKEGQGWAWWIFLLSGGAGFASFLAYLGYGYLDTWHGWATLGLLPVWIGGLVMTRRLMDGGQTQSAEPLSPEAGERDLMPRQRWGRALLLFCAFGLSAAGGVILTVGMTSVFVPQDLEFMGITVEELDAINPRLVPLIAHDRSGFGGAVLVFGLILGACLWFGQPRPSMWQAVTLAGALAFATAIGVHPAVGYNDIVHLAPAITGAGLFALGAWMFRTE